MKIITTYITKNPCYKRNKARTDARDVLFQERGARGLMLHSVGCSVDDGEVFVVRWDKASNYTKAVHAIISSTNGNIYHMLPWNFRGWHAGKNRGNNEYIGVEMCESKGIKYLHGSVFKVTDRLQAEKDCKTTYKQAVELFAYLCEKLNLDPLKDIISHAEGYKKGIASNHGDPEHYWKGLNMPYTMDTFRADVKSQTKKNEASENSKGIKYKVVTAGSNLNVRNKPNGDIIGKLKNGWTVKYYGESDGKYYYIKKPSIGLEGWVHSDYLKKLNS